MVLGGCGLILQSPYDTVNNTVNFRYIWILGISNRFEMVGWLHSQNKIILNKWAWKTAVLVLQTTPANVFPPSFFTKNWSLVNAEHTFHAQWGSPRNVAPAQRARLLGLTARRIPWHIPIPGGYHIDKEALSRSYVTSALNCYVQRFTLFINFTRNSRLRSPKKKVVVSPASCPFTSSPLNCYFATIGKYCHLVVVNLTVNDF